MNATLMLVCLASTSVVNQNENVVFRAPLIEVRQSQDASGKPHLYLMYNRTYIARNYAKPERRADIGNPKTDWSRCAGTYFHDRSPVGIVLQKYNWFPGEENTYSADARLPASLVGLGTDPFGQLTCLWSEPPLAIVGLDVGSLASYARPAQVVHCTERLGTLVKLSQPDQKKKQPYFHFVQDALDRGACLKIFEGEPRATFEKHGSERFYQVIIVETYKLPDAVIHKDLLTRESLQMLMGKLRDDGILCFHISNRHYDLVPIIASAAKDVNYACLVGRDMQDWDADRYRFSSEWVMVARAAKHLAHLKPPPGFDPKREIDFPYWVPPSRTDKKFIWNDKGVNSFRGVYRDDPDIHLLRDVLSDAYAFLSNRVGIPPSNLRDGYMYASRLVNGWSDWSAQRKNSGFEPATHHSNIPLEFESGPLQVRRNQNDGNELFDLMYHVTYLGRNYAKPQNRADYGNPEVDLSRFPTCYHHDKSPIGIALQKYNWFPGKENTYAADARLPVSLIGLAPDPLGQMVGLWAEPPIASLGLEIGTLASYARPTQTIHFTERVPGIVQLSLPNGNKRPHFHYVRDAMARGAWVQIFEGEPRETFEKQAGERFYQMILIDFAKVPDRVLHKELLTKEAMQMFMSKLRDDGILCYHTSNRHYDLDPVIGSTARDSGLVCVAAKDWARWDTDRRDDRFVSNWVLVARKSEHLAHLKPPMGYEKAVQERNEPYWRPVERMNKKFIWTDKGENSFRGLYYTDPAIDQFNSQLYAVDRFLVRVGVSHRVAYKIMNPVHEITSRWSWARGKELNRELPEPPKKNEVNK